MSIRAGIASAAVTVVAVAAGLAFAIAAFVVVDQRAVDIMRVEPRTVPAEKKSTSSAHTNRTNVRRDASQASPGAPAVTSGSAASTDKSTVGSAAAGQNATAPRPAPQQTVTGETRPPPDTTFDHRGKRHRHAHHRSTERSKRLVDDNPPAPARDSSPGHAPESAPGAARASPPGSQNGNTSASFFPFR